MFGILKSCFFDVVWGTKMVSKRTPTKIPLPNTPLEAEMANLQPHGWPLGLHEGLICSPNPQKCGLRMYACTLGVPMWPQNYPKLAQAPKIDSKWCPKSMIFQHCFAMTPLSVSVQNGPKITQTQNELKMILVWLYALPSIVSLTWSPSLLILCFRIRTKIWRRSEASRSSLV